MASLVKKKTELELELLTDIDMLLMLENGIRGEICQAIYRYVKANNNYMNNYDKRKTTYHVFRSKQFARMGNVSKTSNEWLVTSRRSVSI